MRGKYADGPYRRRKRIIIRNMLVTQRVEIILNPTM
jgi:hypothetical protein